MTINLEKELEEATVAKKRYRSLFWVAAISFLVVVGIIYYNTVFVYAVLNDVVIEREEGNRQINFDYEIVTPGRIDFYHGDAILSDVKKHEGRDGFQWTWGAEGETEISVRSRQWIFPYWDRKTYLF